MAFGAALSGLLAVTAFGCAMSAAEPASEDVDRGSAALTGGPTGESAAPVAAAATCPGKYASCIQCGAQSCGQTCCHYDGEPGVQRWEEDDCSYYAKAAWAPKPQPPVLCHLDPDVHISGVDMEIYAAAAYEDTSCAPRPDAWKKTLVATVHCSLWVSITDRKHCEEKVQAKIGELAAQGYVPIFHDGDKDYCPQPRL